MEDADSREFAPDGKHLVIDYMPGQTDDLEKGGTMRLGAYPCQMTEGSLLNRCYGVCEASERHRHRYEFNNAYRTTMEEKGLMLSGRSPDDRIIEAVELPKHEFYLGVQFHPEFKSRPNRPHPLFVGLIKAAMNRRACSKTEN